MSGDLFLNQLVNGVGTGMIYFLLAVGLTLIFGVRTSSTSRTARSSSLARC